MPRHRVPTALKLIRGNPGKRPINRNEPQPSRDVTMPDWLSPEARKHWPMVAEQLHNAGLLTAIDVTALGLYCEAFARWKQANAQIMRFGTVIKSPSGYPIQSPYLAIANKAHEQMTKLLAEFGMTPSSRSHCTVAKPIDPSPYARFVKKM
ncbi:P27 family phage terminase small subunit [Burkholderia pseudomallei]|uniref:phage terminase small subunit P27 family n=2 Tax=Burkholderia pseudomallei TaxID=28450 RepID=UPI00050DF5BB|nr:phage terminase small subunit P27 family [Burkholderia pseudomallei]KGC42330.1 phage terminase, small subunit, P27 family [Burkholderia pseudomallei]KGV09543.1 phage terminase, small subunit, P27 family [Burkholderia pseudomallei MSHR4503]KGV43845.1 phage terminase, small subunit, P27 family [Burkholderia pseudomallei MSHR4012]KGV50137.1 phage terminase, small subunit, P27 family [Burkholderia pseudomallei MSHR4003]MBO7934197.1 phage terminase small subunit P27 family [Burkholderia pseudoma